MKNIILISLGLLSCVLSCTAQKMEERPISPFSKLEIAGALTVIYTESDTISLKVKAKDSELNRVETKIENGTLFLVNKGVFTMPVLIYLKSNKLENVLTGGASSFKTTNTLSGTNLQIDANGAATLKIKAQVQNIHLTSSGSSNVNLSGTTENFMCELSGASTLNSYSLSSKAVTVSTTGASKAKVYGIDRVVANASGASAIKLKGDPKEVVIETSPAASVTKSTAKVSVDAYDESDSTSFIWKGKKIIVVNDHKADKDEVENEHESSFKHWKGLAFGVNGYMNANGGMNVPKTYNYMDLNYSRSYNIQLNIIERQFNIAKDYVKLVTGLGLDYHYYEFANKTRLNADSSFTWGKIDSSNTYTYQKNKFRASYLQVPLMLEFNTSNNPDKTFHIAIGVIGQYLIGSRTKQVLEQNKYELTNIRKDTYNLSPFTAKAHVNLGYRGWTLFAEYSLNRLFEAGKGPELYPFAAGIRVLPFG